MEAQKIRQHVEGGTAGWRKYYLRTFSGSEHRGPHVLVQQPNAAPRIPPRVRRWQHAISTNKFRREVLSNEEGDRQQRCTVFQPYDAGP